MQKTFLNSLLFLSFTLVVYTGFSQAGLTEIKQLELYASSRNIINGTPYSKSNIYKGNQFFGSQHWKIGDIVYDGKTYSNVPMNYNILEAELIILDENYGNARWIKLNKKFINSFSFVDKVDQKKSSFVCVDLISGQGKEIYEKAYSGTISFYIKHKKSVRKQIDDKYMGVMYDTNKLYLKKDGEVFPFYSKSKLLDVIGNKKAMRSFIFKNRLRIHKKHPEDIATLLAYYDILNN